MIPPCEWCGRPFPSMRSRVRHGSAHNLRVGGHQVVRGTEADRAYRWVQFRPGVVASEIPQYSQATRSALTHLAKQGLIRQGQPRMSKATRRPCVTWWPVESALAVAG